MGFQTTNKTPGIALLAGSGCLPKHILASLVQKDIKPLLIALENDVDVDLFEYCINNNIINISIAITELGKLIKTLKEHKISKIILAGGVSSRPSLRDLKFDKYSFVAFQKLFLALKKGDDSLLSAFIKLLEFYNVDVIGAEYFVPELLAPFNSVITSVKTCKRSKKDIEVACKALNLLAPLDLGQAAVSIGGRLVAVEGPEGTDAMLRRVQELRSLGKIVAKGGVLVKITKTGQEKRVDLPTIGLNTIEEAHKAALSGIAIESGASFILDKDQTIKLANKYNLFIQTISIAEHHNESY